MCPKGRQKSQKKRCEDRPRGQSNSVSGSPKPKIVDSKQKLEKGKKTYSSLETPKGNPFCWHLISVL